jgi:hypothetical protein
MAIALKRHRRHTSTAPARKKPSHERRRQAIETADADDLEGSCIVASTPSSDRHEPKHPATAP